MLKTIKKLQAWGNSYGIRLSKKELEREKIMPNEDVEILIIKKSNPAREVFGALKGKIRKSTDRVMEDIDKAFESRFD